MLCDLLFLQAAHLPSAEAKAVLEDAYGRVFAIARLHEQLYQSITSGEIRLAEYLDRLVVGCAEVHPDVRILLDAPDHQLALDVDRAIHLGLVVNELMLNAIKHAFAAGEQGEVRVGVRRVGEDVELQVRDTGKGLPPEFTIEAAASLGLRIVNVLAQRLRASVRMENAGGAAFTLRFPLQADESVEPR
jgi:two-component sensor histidine kinase